MLDANNPFLTIFEGSPLGMALSDLSGKLLQCNKAIQKMLGYTEQELKNKKFTDFTHPEDIPREWELFQQAMLANGDHYRLEKRYIRKDGSLCWGRVNTSIVRDAAGVPQFFIRVVEDINQQKLAQEKVAHWQKEMARMDRLNLLGEMAAGLGHEVRNPLATVKGFLQLMASKEDCTQYLHYIQLMLEELDRANDILSEYLTMGSDRPTELTLQNLNTIIKAILPLIQAYAWQKNQWARVELAELPNLPLNGKEMRQVIHNLARNGLDAMAEGKLLTIKTLVDKDAVVLAVQDEGSGIAPEIMGKLGTPFLTTKENGTGLGLAICYGIAARHNAKLTVETGTEGSTFCMRFPLSIISSHNVDK